MTDQNRILQIKNSTYTFAILASATAGFTTNYNSNTNLWFQPDVAVIKSIKYTSTVACDGKTYGIRSSIQDEIIGTFCLPGNAVGGSWNNPQTRILIKKPIQSLSFGIYVVDQTTANSTFGSFIGASGADIGAGVGVLSVEIDWISYDHSGRKDPGLNSIRA